MTAASAPEHFVVQVVDAHMSVDGTIVRTETWFSGPVESERAAWQRSIDLELAAEFNGRRVCLWHRLHEVSNETAAAR